MKLLVTGAWSEAEKHFGELGEMGHSVVFMQNESDNLPCDAKEVEGVVCNGLFLHHGIEQFTNLKFIQLTSAGLDRVPLEYTAAHGISVYNARGVYSKPMAEFAICGVLQLYKRSGFFYNNKLSRKWKKRRDIYELDGKRVLIVGCGSVGSECAKRFKAFGCEVSGVDLKPYESEYFSDISGLDCLNERLSLSDIVVLTLPLTAETKGLFDESRFEKMKEGAVFVNIARGAIADERALSVALDKKLFGAVLDVFEEEPLPPESELWGKENVILTPHVSFLGDLNGERFWHVVSEVLNGIYEKN